MNREQRYRYKDVIGWPEDERWELIDGVPFGMAAPTVAHQDWAGEIFFQIKAQLKGKPCKPFIAPVDLLPTLKPGEVLDSSDTVVQPDVMVVCNPDQIGEKIIFGPPALVVEVQSPHTAFRDQTEKLKLYEGAGVAEYLIVNPVNLVVYAFRLGADRRYGKPEVWMGPAVVALASLPGVELDFTVSP